MANIKSAKKRAKQAAVRNARNSAQRSMLRTAVKKVVKAIDAKDVAAAGPRSPWRSRSSTATPRVA